MGLSYRTTSCRNASGRPSKHCAMHSSSVGHMEASTRKTGFCPVVARAAWFATEKASRLKIELEQTEQYKSPGAHWSAFAKKLRRLVGDAIRLWRRKPELSVETYASRRDCLDRRLAELVDGPWEDPHSRRLVKRLRRHQYDLFTFLDQAGVPFDNNHAERSIRPAVILRKNSYGNRSQRGTDCQAVLMSVFRTLKQRGHDPIQTVVQAIEQYLAHNTLPHLPPPKIASDG